MSNNTVQLEKTRVFQWIKGDSFGKVVTLKEEDSEFLYFTDGSQIYKTVAKEFLLESLDGDMPLPDAKPLGNGSKVNSRTSIIAENVYEDKSPTQISQQISQQIPTETPLQSLIAKLSQKNVETVDFSLGINLPKKEVFAILLENSDEERDELIDTITESVASKIEIDSLKEYLKEQLNTYINNYYNG